MGAVVWIGFHNFLAPFFLLVGAVGLIAVVAGIRLRPSAPSRALLLLALLPMLTMLGLFYSLAVHMHQHLGSWPKSIGTEGFPPPLQIHADAAYWYFGLLVLANLLLLPVGLLLCTFVRGWRGGIFYIGVYALSFCVGFAVMLLAPAPFLNWWWD
jgi:hypothetical protein